MTQRLPVNQIETTGTPDGTKFLRDDGTWAIPGEGPGTGGNSRALVEEITLASPAASIAFASLPTSGYRHLELVLQARSTLAALADAVKMAFNADTTAGNYKIERLYGQNTMVGANTYTDRTVAAIQAATSPAGYATLMTMRVANYRDTTWTKPFHSDSAVFTADTILYRFSGLWTSTAAISSITLTCGANFASGSKAQLYALT